MFIPINGEEITLLLTHHKWVSSTDERMSNQRYCVTKWCWRDKGMDRLQ